MNIESPYNMKINKIFALCSVLLWPCHAAYASLDQFSKIQPFAAQGNAAAQFKLAEMYLDGQGVTENKDKAFEWFL